MSKIRIAFFTNTTCRTNAAVLDECAKNPNLELARVFLYNTRAELWRSPVKVVRQFGMKGLIERAVPRDPMKFWRTATTHDEAAHNPSSPTALQICKRNSISHTVVRDINSSRSLAALRELRLDALVVCACKNILRDAALSCPKLGVINIHPSYLPDYRGPCPIFWALINGESTLGVTIHRMTRRIDSGMVLWQTKIPTPKVTAATDERLIERQLFGLAAEHLDASLRALASQFQSGDQASEPSSPGSYFGYPNSLERDELSRKIQNRKN
ncbi:MAG TPA: hypothetical protein DDW52_28175 [Planctomycetaceae bacterium]|nr:hypothetical protein [Planctomycetaceae bacterium]